MVLLGQSSDTGVQVLEPDPSWPTQFDSIRAQIAAALGPIAVRIDHVGSTAVPSLVAKETIDVQVSVTDIESEDAYAPALADLGWPLRLRESDHRFFREPAGVPRRTHVHVCPVGSEWERRHLLFRDYLRAHPERAAGYGELKRALAVRYPRDRVAYTEAKGPFIDETMELAEAWAAATGWRP